jgi:hypothetical protein
MYCDAWILKRLKEESQFFPKKSLHVENLKVIHWDLGQVGIYHWDGKPDHAIRIEHVEDIRLRGLDKR